MGAREKTTYEDAARRGGLPLITVVVPVYKVQGHLARCVESIKSQTYPYLQIVLVDDGSPDDCPAMCDAYAASDERILAIHKQNGGLSSARNAGVDAAAGDYIGFVDSDDYIAPDMYEHLLAMALATGAGICCCGVADVYPNRTERPAQDIACIMAPEEALSDIFLNKTLMVGIPPRLYPFWLMREVSSPVGRSHEDAFMVVDLFSRVESVAVDTRPRYFYCHNEETITTTPATRALMDNIEAWERNRELVERLYPGIIQDVMFRCYWAHFDVLDGMVLSNAPASARIPVIDWLLEHESEILAHPAVSAKRKLALKALSVSEGLYKKLVLAQAGLVKYN